MSQSIYESSDQLAVLEQDLIKQKLDMQELVTAVADLQRLASVGMLTAGIAQELANLLSIVSTAGISLRHELQQLEDSPVDIAEPYLTLIERNAFRAGQIVTMLQGYGALDGQQMAITDIDAILRDMMILVERQLREGSNVQVQVETADKTQSLVCDHNRIVQLLVNLLLYAREAMPESGGLIEVKVRTAQGKHASHGNGAAEQRADGIERITIAISGEGRASDQEEKSRPADLFKANGNGAGLGLSVAQEIVRQHDGEIQFSNKRGPGMGASVIVVLPVRPPD